jgi:hypothetical protein
MELKLRITAIGELGRCAIPKPKRGTIGTFGSAVSQRLLRFEAFDKRRVELLAVRLPSHVKGSDLP